MKDFINSTAPLTNCAVWDSIHLEVHIHVGFGYLDLWTTVNTATPVEDLSITKGLDLPPQTSTCLLPEMRLSLVGLLEALLLVLCEALVP